MISSKPMSMQIALADLSGHKVDIDRNVKEGSVGRSVKSGGENG